MSERMVLVTQLDGEYSFLKQNASSEQPKCHHVPVRGSLSGIRTPLYLLGAPAESNGDYEGFSCTAEGQSMLEALILSQWEDRAWKGQVSYDVTSNEIKVIGGGKNFICQLNEKWNPTALKEFENKAFQLSGLIKSSYMRAHCENILFCVASGEKESSEFIPSNLLPNSGTMVIINANPIEYGHILLVPYCIHQRPRFLDKRTLELITRMATEINSCSFHVFYDYNASTESDHKYFQASFFADPLPVELLPTVPICGNLVMEGVLICEVADYPLKALVFRSKNLNSMVEVVAELCSTLQKHNTTFNLLISDCGRKIYLFPQVHPLVSGRHLSSWECGGYFVCSTKSEYDSVSETEISESMASVSLDEENFQALKLLCCDISVKLAS